MIKLDKCVVVEGKYDKIKLENIIDATIITTNGFRIFKDKETLELLRLLAQKKGLLIITDSDSAGNLIRSHLKGIIPSHQIIKVFLPMVKGKEKRKTKGSAEGYLGLEGLSDEVIISALSKAGVTASKTQSVKKVEKSDLYFCGFSGREGSMQNRKSFLRYENLPDNLSSNLFLEVINSLFTPEAFLTEVEKWKQEQHKN